MPVITPFPTGGNLLKNGDFNAPPHADPFSVSNTLSGWTTQAGGGKYEVVKDGYFGITSGHGWWLDTQASPGAIDMAQNVNVVTVPGILGAKVHIDIAPEDIGGLKTNPYNHLQVLENGKVIGDVTVAQLLGDGDGYNVFDGFDFALKGNVLGITGASKIEVREVDKYGHLADAGHGGSNVGFAIANMSVQQTLDLGFIGQAHDGGWGLHFV